jgi:hypothetical protein
LIGHFFVSRGVEFLVDTIHFRLRTQCRFQLDDRLQQCLEQFGLTQEILYALASDLAADGACVAKGIGGPASAWATIASNPAILALARLALTRLAALIAGLLIALTLLT